MGIPELKEIIRLRLENADEHVLRIVASVLDEQSGDIIALDAKGLPLNSEAYHTKIDEGFADLKAGTVFSNEEMKEKIKQLKTR